MTARKARRVRRGKRVNWDHRAPVGRKETEASLVTRGSLVWGVSRARKVNKGTLVFPEEMVAMAPM